MPVAKKVLVELVDDLDGRSPADETVQFSLDGVEYEIDLSTTNANDLRLVVGEWTKHARKVKATRGAKTAAPQADRERTNAIRDWARRNGLEVSSRGRLAVGIINAYEAAHAS